jgi:hypothetical protein
VFCAPLPQTVPDVLVWSGFEPNRLQHCLNTPPEPPLEDAEEAR